MITPTSPSFLDQFQASSTFGWGEVHLIPGTPLVKTFNFLHYASFSGGDCREFLEVLNERGYYGSRLFWTFNIPFGMEVVKTGQIDGVIVHESGSGWKLNEMADSLHELQFSMPHTCRYFGTHGHRIKQGFGSFLDKCCPLSGSTLPPTEALFPVVNW